MSYWLLSLMNFYDFKNETYTYSEFRIFFPHRTISHPHANLIFFIIYNSKDKKK